jgi:hypothetical protein
VGESGGEGVEVDGWRRAGENFRHGSESANSGTKDVHPRLHLPLSGGTEAKENQKILFFFLFGQHSGNRLPLINCLS